MASHQETYNHTNEKDIKETKTTKRKEYKTGDKPMKTPTKPPANNPIQPTSDHQGPMTLTLPLDYRTTDANPPKRKEANVPKQGNLRRLREPTHGPDFTGASDADHDRRKLGIHQKTSAQKGSEPGWKEEDNKRLIEEEKSHPHILYGV